MTSRWPTLQQQLVVRRPRLAGRGKEKKRARKTRSVPTP